MAERGRRGAATWTAAAGPRRAPLLDAASDSLLSLVRAVAEIAAAATAEEVAAAVVAGAVDVTGGRGAAVGAATGSGQVRLLGSAGYDCDTMRAGAMLPADAGLPLTECVRTGNAVRQGRPGEPMWIALPVPTTTGSVGLV